MFVNKGVMRDAWIIMQDYCRMVINFYEESRGTALESPVPVISLANIRVLG